jgi:hypothetical protein
MLKEAKKIGIFLGRSSRSRIEARTRQHTLCASDLVKKL